MSQEQVTWSLAVTEANHRDDAFYELGAAGFTSEAEMRANLSTIPVHRHHCDADDACYILDIWDGDGLIDDQEISAETAMTILGVDDLTPLREDAKERIAALVAACS